VASEAASLTMQFAFLSNNFRKLHGVMKGEIPAKPKKCIGTILAMDFRMCEWR
jgi:hypothetical protein